MNFLAPWFLLGALAVAGPVAFHLIRRSVRERMMFSSTLFLRPTPPRATRRRKLEHILLLLLRCLAVLLLAGAFARPFFPKHNALPPPAETGRQMILLLDTSASMRREGLWPKARSIAERYIKGASLADRVGLMTFDRQPRTVFSLAEWSSWPVDRREALAKERLDTLSPGWGGTHLGLALTTAAEQLGDLAHLTATPGARDLALISDLQEGAALDGLQGHDWPKGVRVIIERVDPARPGNAGVQILDSSLANSGDGLQARARLVNARDSNREKFLVGWAAEDGTGFSGKPAEIYLPPGQSRVFSPPRPAPGAATVALRLTGDEEAFDNTAWFAATEKETVTVAYFGLDPANDPDHMRYYVDRAFPETPRRQVEVVSVVSNSVFSPALLNRASLAVVPGGLAADEARVLRDWIAGGKNGLLILSNAQSGASLGALAGAAELDVSEAAADYGLFGEIDFTHPLFAPFADPRFSDFSRIHFWKHRRWNLPANLPANLAVRVLARFDDRAPALAQISLGKGSLLVLSAGWHPADSQLAVSSKFLPLMQTILDWSGSAAPARSQFEVGQALPSPASAGDALQWRKPDGKVVTLPAGTPFSETDLPGIYLVTGGSRTRRFAVNLPLDESRTAPLSSDDFARLGVPLSTAVASAVVTSPAAKRRFLEEELENRQKLWRWLVLGLLGIALVEIVLGGWLANRVKNFEVTP